MHCNILNLLGLNFDFCDFCAFLRLYQTLKLCVFDHYSNIPSFHVGDIKPVSVCYRREVKNGQVNEYRVVGKTLE